jgi:hypothetical protein
MQQHWRRRGHGADPFTFTNDHRLVAAGQDREGIKARIFTTTCRYTKAIPTDPIELIVTASGILVGCVNRLTAVTRSLSIQKCQLYGGNHQQKLHTTMISAHRGVIINELSQKAIYLQGESVGRKGRGSGGG